jgi:hypothetical protein
MVIVTHNTLHIAHVKAVGGLQQIDSSPDKEESHDSRDV